MKSDAVIERETASKWKKLAVDCWRRYLATGDERWLVRATNYRHEALEHAGTVGDYGRTLARVQRALDKQMWRRPRKYRRASKNFKRRG